mmetsp:Transcript_7925/g.23360  ORF Transcript_7925/g.23360 Transcript_7925/m.23360 type:complete len:284 (-) Transcript_7925:3586-4437(-)
MSSPVANPLRIMSSFSFEVSGPCKNRQFRPRTSSREYPVSVKKSSDAKTIGLSWRLGSVMTNECCDCWMLVTRLKSSWSRSGFSPQASKTSRGRFRAALHCSSSTRPSSDSTSERTMSRSAAFSRWSSRTSFCSDSKKNFFRSRVLRAKMRFRSRLRSIWAWVFLRPRPCMAAAAAAAATTAGDMLAVPLVMYDVLMSPWGATSGGLVRRRLASGAVVVFRGAAAGAGGWWVCCCWCCACTLTAGCACGMYWGMGDGWAMPWAAICGGTINGGGAGTGAYWTT